MIPTSPIRESDIIGVVVDWFDSGHQAALATVVSTWGSSPCPTGSHLGVRDDGTIAGSVSAGCVEGAVINEAMEIIKLCATTPEEQHKSFAATKRGLEYYLLAIDDCYEPLTSFSEV